MNLQSGGLLGGVSMDALMRKKYVVRLSDREHDQLAHIVRKFKGSSQIVRGAQILLKADADGTAWMDQQIV